MSDEIRTPKQERSIETKSKIIRAGFELFSEVGYYSTNTAEIARRAGVSTGIVYGYFKDKRDILLDVLESYIQRAYSPVFEMLGKLEHTSDLPALIEHIIDMVIATHRDNANIHEALHSMTHTDEAVNQKFIELEDRITLELASRLSAIGFDTSDKEEKIHLAMDIIQSFSHEYVYDKHSYIDYAKMKKLVINCIAAMF